MSFQINQKRVGPTNPTAGVYTIDLPRDAKILRGRIRRATDRLVIWYLHDTDETEVEQRTIAALEVGVPIVEDVQAMRMIGYGQSAGTLLHLFELYYNGAGGLFDEG